MSSKAKKSFGGVMISGVGGHVSIGLSLRSYGGVGMESIAEPKGPDVSGSDRAEDLDKKKRPAGSQEKPEKGHGYGYGSAGRKENRDKKRKRRMMAWDSLPKTIVIESD